MISAAPHLFLEEPSHTKIAVPAWIDLAMFISVGSESWCWGFHGLGGWGCGLLLEVMNYSCVLYNISEEVFCNSRGVVCWREEVYINLDFSQHPVAWSALSSNYRPV